MHIPYTDEQISHALIRAQHRTLDPKPDQSYSLDISNLENQLNEARTNILETIPWEDGVLDLAFVVMNVRRYVDIRKFARDLIELETDVEAMKQGLQSYLWTQDSPASPASPVPIVCSRLIPEDCWILVPVQPKADCVLVKFQ